MNGLLFSLLKFYCAASRILVKIYSDSSRILVGFYSESTDSATQHAYFFGAFPSVFRANMPRYCTLGLIGTRLHMLVFTWRDGTMRVISLRKSNAREIRGFENG